MTDNHPALPSHRVLLAEDDDDFRELLSLTLQHSGWDVIGVADGEKALKVLRVELLPLAVLNDCMPYLGGYDVIKCLLREVNVRMPGRVIFTSAHWPTPSQRAILRRVGAKLLLKPFSLSAFRRNAGPPRN